MATFTNDAAATKYSADSTNLEQQQQGAFKKGDSSQVAAALSGWTKDYLAGKAGAEQQQQWWKGSDEFKPTEYSPCNHCHRLFTLQDYRLQKHEAVCQKSGRHRLRGKFNATTKRLGGFLDEIGHRGGVCFAAQRLRFDWRKQNKAFLRDMRASRKKGLNVNAGIADNCQVLISKRFESYLLNKGSILNGNVDHQGLDSDIVSKAGSSTGLQQWWKGSGDFKEIDREPCRYCQRQFIGQRLLIHEGVCMKNGRHMLHNVFSSQTKRLFAFGIVPLTALPVLGRRIPIDWRKQIGRAHV